MIDYISIWFARLASVSNMIWHADPSIHDTPASQADILAPVAGPPEAALAAFLCPFYYQCVVVSLQLWRCGLSLIRLMYILST